ncbi:MAG TPA: YraN family protein [Alphaproteobacteria bacterium]|nr:YraN family protein [Alphaproteobacteria bacterium]HNS43649.1 YraN family protein [Alphaproteobacteria bacterium]
MKSFSTNYARGMIAEIYAAAYLLLKGYRIRAWRYKTPVGEVDLIAEKNRATVFVEVKLRPTAEEGLNAITPQMKSRISRASTHYLASKAGKNACGCRFDVVVVSGFRLSHLDNAWEYPT